MMKRVFTPTKKKTILILDDDQPASQGYREKLQAQGFKVEVTAAFDTTLQIFKNTAVDLAILDLCLPGINVLELIKNIRSDSVVPSTPIIAFSNPYLGTLKQALWKQVQQNPSQKSILRQNDCLNSCASSE